MANVFGKSWVNWVCPRDGSPLSCTPNALECPDCRVHYAVRDGVVTFAPEPGSGAQRFERERRDRYLEFNGGLRDHYERRVEAEAVVRRLALGAGDRVLDAGCGVGRITQLLLATGARVCGVDFSGERLRRLRERASADGRLELAVADLHHLPFAPATFSCVVSTQVLEHVPGREQRRAVLARFHQLLAPGGRLLLTVYNFSRPWRQRGEAREGLHETGIFYHCYEPEELADDLSDFDGLEVCGIIQLLPHTYRLLPRLGALGRRLDHALEPVTGFSREWGHLLLARAVKPAAGLDLPPTPAHHEARVVA